MRFTVESARFNAAKAIEARRRNAIEREIQANLPKPAPGPAPGFTGPETELFCSDLSRACEETLTLIREADEPIHRAQLARALRDLRETWHLATGKPRPGLAKVDQHTTPSRQIPRVYPGVYGGNTPDQNGSNSTT